MSLVLGFRLEDRVLVAADSCGRVGTMRVSLMPKLERWGEYVIGSTGTQNDTQHFIRTLPPDADLLNRKFLFDHAESMGRQRLWLQQNTGLGDLVAMLLIARGREALIVNQTGSAIEFGDHFAVGSGQQVALYLLHTLWQPGMSLPATVDLAAHIVTETAKVDIGVAPPVLWADTVELKVRSK